jgi:hypothetical protein
VGKFCFVAALSTPARLFGIEQRRHFVETAQAIVHRYRIPRVAFACRNLKDTDWSEFQGVYLFNPFQENQTPENRLDSSVELRRDLFDEYVRCTEARLATLKKGSRVATYHGFGGSFPRAYRRRRLEFCERGPLELWEKVA